MSNKPKLENLDPSIQDKFDKIVTMVGDANDYKTIGDYYLPVGITNAPTSNNSYFVKIFSDGLLVTQIAYGRVNDAMFVRRFNSTWSSWINYSNNATNISFTPPVGMTATDVQQAIVENFTQVVDGKNSVEVAIEAKGGTVSDTNNPPTFSDLVTGVNSIPQAQGDATTSQVLSGRTFTSAVYGATQQTGTIPSKTAQTFTPSTSNQTISSGQYLSGTQTILGDADLVASNIKSGVNIFGVNGTLVEGFVTTGGGAYTLGTLSGGNTTSTSFVEFDRKTVHFSGTIYLNLTLNGSTAYGAMQYYQFVRIRGGVKTVLYSYTFNSAYTTTAYIGGGLEKGDIIAIEGRTNDSRTACNVSSSYIRANEALIT